MKKLGPLLLFWAISVTPSWSQISGKVELVEGNARARKGVSKAILVYVDGVKANIPQSLRTKEVEVRSKDKAFAPRVEVVPVGASIRFPNLDNIMHNVFSLSRGNRFDLGLYKSGAFKTYTFNSSGLVRVYCNIHPQMSAYIHVLDSPYFAWVNPDGSFRIDAVPEGRYELNVWTERGQATQSVIVRDGGASGVLLKLDVSRFRRRAHKNKFGKRYKKKRGKY